MPRKARPMSTPPVVPPSDLERQLQLARAQNAYLHRQLAEALKLGPLAPVDTDTTQVALDTLREQYAILKLHYADAQSKIQWLKHDLAFAYRVLKWGPTAEGQTTLEPTDGAVEALLLKLLVLAHPDKWSQGQPATALAHELTLAIQSLRERVHDASP